MDLSTSVALARGVRLQWEEAQQARVLLYPEGMVKLNGPAGEILALCDGRSVSAIISELNARFPGADVQNDVLEFLSDARQHGWVQWQEAGDDPRTD
jgi:pyrroloquinoline quinone biosynthesis protein D